MGAVAKNLMMRRPLLLVTTLVVAVLVSVIVIVPAKGGTPYPISDVGLVDPSQGLWHLRNTDDEVTSFFYGTPGDLPFMGDWDCDGVDTPGLYRQSDGFVYLRNSNTAGPGTIRFFFGNPGDIPIAGDFNGDGCDTVSIYRPSEGRVYIINKLGENEGGLGQADYWYYFGIPGDKPFTGDFDGDGKDTVGLHRESTGRVYFQNTHWLKYDDGGNQIGGGAPTAADFIYGNPGDRLVAGDWNGDGKDSPVLFRPSNRTLYFRFTNTQGVADDQYSWGDTGWIPVSGDFGPLSSGVNVSLSGATSGLKNAVEAYYLWYWGAPEIPGGLYDFLYSSAKWTLYPKPRSDSITGWAKTETVGGTQVAVVGTGSDILLLVSEEGDHWRVVGSKLARHGLPAWYGDPPRQLLVLGGDARPGSNPLTSNADSIHIVTVDPATGTGAITGLPRDTFIPVSYGTGIDKLGITMRGRGPQSSLKEIKAISGIPIEGYIVTAFEDYTNLIDDYAGFWADLPYPRDGCVDSGWQFLMGT
ncbi:MAG: LCP family protein, partial [Acidimicrobiia bacterium]